MPKKRAKRKPQYCVGHKTEGFCWLLGIEEGEPADDGSIEIARRFSSIEEADKAAEEHGGSVYQIVDEKAWPAILEEI